MSLSFLQSLGLSENESHLYELLLKLGEVPASKIIQEVPMKRPTIYLTLNNLVIKGLVSKRDIHKRIHFRPESPASLLNLANEQSQRLEQAKKDLQSAMPLLVSSYIMAVEKPIVQTFEGVEGLKEIYEDTLIVGQEIYAVLQTATITPSLQSWLDITYVKKRIKKKIPAKVIISSGKLSKKYKEKSMEELRTTIVVPHKLFPFAHEIDIYGDKVAFINYHKNEALIGIIITHPKIAQTMKALFSLAWTGPLQNK